MPSIEYRPDRPKAWRAIYWGPDGKRHSRSFARESDAKRWLTSEEAAKLQGTWADPNQGRRRFNDWADEWWAVWSADPGRSPKTLEAAESHLRLPPGRARTPSPARGATTSPGPAARF